MIKLNARLHRVLTSLGMLVGAFVLLAVSTAHNTTTAAFSGTTTGAASASTVASYACNPGYSNLITGTSGVTNYWRLGETSGTSAAATVGATAGTYVGTPTLNQAASRASMASNPSIRLNGSNQYVNMGDINDFSGTAAFSVEAWVKRDAASTSYDRIVTKEGVSGSFRTGWSMYMRPQVDGYTVGLDRFDGTATNDTVGSTTRMELNRWYHVVATFSSSQLNIYVDGKLEGTSASTRSLANTANPFRIGSDQNGASVFHGGIDDVSVYSTALSLATVQSHYKGCASLPVPAYIQGANTQAYSGSTMSQAFSGNTTTGNAIVVAAMYSANSTSATCSDNRGNTYVTATTTNNGTTSSNRRLIICYALNVSGGATTVTVTGNAAFTSVRLAIHEYSNIADTAAADGTTSINSGTSSTTPSSGNITTTTGGDLVFGAVVSVSAMTTSNAGSGYTIRQRASSSIYLATEDLVQPSAGTIAATFDIAPSTGYMAGILALKAG